MRLPFLTGVISCLVSVSAIAADAIVVRLPCDSDPFPRCADLKKRLVEGTTTPLTLPGLNGAVADLMSDVYAGKVKVPADAVTGSGTCSTLNLVGNPEICPPLRVPENGCRDEFRVNVNGKSCGDFAKAGAKGNGQFYYTLGRSANGSLETANLSGGLILAVSNQAADIAKEINANTLHIAANSSCNAQAIYLNELIRAQSDVRLLELVKGCDMTNTETCSTKKYFEAALSNIEAAYVLLARCRLTEEATSKFRVFVADYLKPADALVADCMNRNPKSNAMKSCYQGKWESWIKTRARAMFPNVAAACGGA